MTMPRPPYPPVLEALAAAGLVSLAGGRALLPIGGGEAAEVDVDGDWLCFELAPAAPPDVVSAWSLLRLHRGAAGGVKAAARAGGAVPALRAEVPFDDVTEVVPLVCEVRAGFAEVLRRWRAEPEAPPADGGTEAADVVATLCRESVWPAREIEGGRWLVDLEDRDGLWQARLESSRGRVRAVVEVLSAEVGAGAEPCARQAVALFLLRAAAMVRFARPITGEADAAFEVELGPDATAGRLHHALCALSLASRLCAREASALARDAGTARAYLRLATETAAAGAIHQTNEGGTP